jgi:hypothetical protein
MQQAASVLCSEELWLGVGLFMTILYVCVLAVNVGLYFRECHVAENNQGNRY